MDLVIVITAYCFEPVLILNHQSNSFPSILLDDAVKHISKVDLRWAQVEVERVVLVLVTFDHRHT